MHKIIIICTQLEAGGAQRAAIRLAEYLRSQGHDCENWFLYKKSEAFKTVSPIRVLHIGQKPPRNLIRVVRDLRQELSACKPDVVISFAHNANIIAQFAAFLCRVPVRMASHRNPRWGYMSYFHRLADYLWAVSGIYTNITAVSESTKASYSGYPPAIFNRIQVIHNGLVFQPSEKTQTEARKQFGLPSSGCIIGNVGRLSPQKNQQILLYALSMLNNEMHLVIAGEGELRDELVATMDELHLNGRVHLPGELDSEEIPELLEAIDIFVLPSKFEGLSNALLEAMSAGKPVICSSIDAQKEVLINNEGDPAGMLISPDDPGKWAEAVNMLWSDRKLYDKYSERSRARAKEFTMKAMGNRFLRLMNRNVDEF